MTKKIVLCDRCGAEVKYPLIKEYRLQRNHGKSYDDEIDLCQNCIDSFEKWFKNEVIKDDT